MNIRIKKILILILITIFAIAFTILFLRALFYFPSDEISLPPEIAQEVINKDQTTLPILVSTEFMRLIIPKINLNAEVKQVGITSKGNMAAPRKFSEVGWYKYGVYPGFTGSAVLAGHVDNGIALPAVFSNLKDLIVGDDIYMNVKDGEKLHFVVVGHTVYNFDSAPKEVFAEKNGKFLKLITCTGNWLKEFRTHDKRLVVKAVLVEE